MADELKPPVSPADVKQAISSLQQRFIALLEAQKKIAEEIAALKAEASTSGVTLTETVAAVAVTAPAPVIASIVTAPVETEKSNEHDPS